MSKIFQGAEQREEFDMVRGVHKKIIEVADTQNEFFERAILIVKEGDRKSVV